MVKAGYRKCHTTTKANWDRAKSSALGRCNPAIGPPNFSSAMPVRENVAALK
jgi:hypothetical protein